MSSAFDTLMWTHWRPVGPSSEHAQLAARHEPWVQDEDLRFESLAHSWSIWNHGNGWDHLGTVKSSKWRHDVLLQDCCLRRHRDKTVIGRKQEVEGERVLLFLCFNKDLGLLRCCWWRGMGWVGKERIKVELIFFVRRFHICKFAYSLKCICDPKINNHGAFMVIPGWAPVQSVKKLDLPDMLVPIWG